MKKNLKKKKVIKIKTNNIVQSMCVWGKEQKIKKFLDEGFTAVGSFHLSYPDDENYFVIYLPTKIVEERSAFQIVDFISQTILRELLTTMSQLFTRKNKDHLKN